MAAPKTIGEKLVYCWRHEVDKFKHMGNYRYLSLLVFLSQFTLFPFVLARVWPYVEGTVPDVVIYAIIVFLVNAGTMLPYNLVMYWVYTKKIPFFEQFRANPQLKWPWEQDAQKWPSTFKKTMKNVITNLLFGVVIIYFDSLVQFDVLMTSESCPDTWTMVWQFFFFLYMEELIFYTFHRLLHQKSLYSYHKQHHQYNVTTSLAIIYSSKVEQFTNVVATGVAYKIFSAYYPVHIFTVIIWLVFRFVESLDGHSGYNWPWGVENWVPFSAGESFHFFHHSNNVGNYGGIVHVFDTLMGTNKDFIEWEEKKGKRLD